ncbi:MAG: hypothetical protein LBR56_05500 [Sporomusaceae bacterium]|nr:hypothetical protein [Sporomusaceae bacterium]
MAIPGLGNFFNPTETENKKLKAKEAEKAAAEKNKIAEQLLFAEEDIEDILEISEESKKKLQELLGQLEEKKSLYEMSESKPSDSSGPLTQRLVSALGQFQVRQVIADANKALLSLRVIAGGNGKHAALARAYARKLEKLLVRADRKIEDLDKEDGLKSQKSRAEKLNHEKRIEEIKKELRKKELERRMRENGYLLEAAQDKMPGTDPTAFNITTQDAALTSQAESMAAAEPSSPTISSGGEAGGETASAGTAAAAVAAEGGGETAE